MMKNKKQFVTIVVALTITTAILIGGFGATISAAKSAMPGDALFPLKAWSENRSSSLLSSNGNNPGEDGKREIVGVLEGIDENVWVIDGQSVQITAQTEIKGTPAVGDIVKVHVTVAVDGTLTAREIETVLEEDGNVNEDDGDANDNEDGNQNDDDGNANDNEDGNENDDDGNANDNEDGNENEDDGDANDNKDDNVNEDDGDANDNEDGNENDDDDDANNNQDGNENEDGGDINDSDNKNNTTGSAGNVMLTALPVLAIFLSVLSKPIGTDTHTSYLSE